MSALGYFPLAALAVLTVCLIRARRLRQHDIDSDIYGTGEESSLAYGWDSSSSEVCARIFDAEDCEFVASRTSRHFSRNFRRERTVLALDWLRVARRQVNRSIRAHLRAARENVGLEPAGEIKLAFEFLLFQLTSGILYVVILACGPPRAAKLVGCSLELARRLRKLTADVLPTGRGVAVRPLAGKQAPKS